MDNDELSEKYNLEANEAKKADDLEKAYKLYTLAIKNANPPQAKYYTNRARVLILHKRYDLACNDADEALRIDPQNHKAFYCKGEVLFKKHDFVLAQRQFEAALKLSPDDNTIRSKIEECKASEHNKSVRNDETQNAFRAQTNVEVKELLAAINRGEFPDQYNQTPKGASERAAAQKEANILKKSVQYVIDAHDYRDGTKGKKQNHRKAVELYDKAAKLGNTEAMYNIAILYKDGRGTPVSFEKALDYLKRATSCSLWVYGKTPRLGVALSHNMLGNMYCEGLGVERDDRKAFEHYKMAAEGGEPGGMSNLGILYETGRGTSIDYSKAIEWFTKASERNWPVAQYNLGLCYKEGRPGVLEKDVSRARELFERAAAQGYSAASIALSELENFSLTAIEAAAETGTPESMHFLAVAYENGIDMYEPDLEQALHWYKKAAKKGFRESQLRLGYLYLFEITNSVEPKRIEKAAKYLQDAAQLDHPQAQHLLSELYRYGDGVKRSADQAKIWYSRAKENGFKEPGLNKEYDSSEPKMETDKEFKELIRQINEWEKSQNLDSESMTNRERVGRFRMSKEEEKMTPEQAKELREVHQSLLNSFGKPIKPVKPTSRTTGPEGQYPLDKLLLYANTSVGQRMIAAKQHFLLSLGNFYEGNIEGFAKEWFEANKLSELVCVLSSDTTQLIVEMTEMFAKENPKNVEAKYALATTYTRLNRPLRVSISLLDDCLALRPREWAFYSIRGSFKCFESMYKEAIHDFDEALRIVGPEKGYEIFYLRAGAYRLKNKTLPKEGGTPSSDAIAALADYEAFLKRAPSEERKIPETYYCIGYLHLLGMDFEKANDYFQRGIEAEGRRLPLFPPINFPIKDSLERMLKMKKISDSSPEWKLRAKLRKNMLTNDPLPRICPVCQQKANKACSGCKKVWYCTREHQKADWKQHKIKCQGT